MTLRILGILLIFSTSLTAQNPLLIPDTLSGSVVNLNIEQGSRTFYPGFTTNTMGVNGNYLGPTIFLRNGDQVMMSVTNSLNDTTTLHWHGLHVPAHADGGPHITILPSSTWSPSFQVKDKASTYWYHPHLHMKTAEHVTKGATGFIIVRDNEEDALLLPRTYGVDDFPLAIQTRAFDNMKQFIVESALDSVVLVNGTMNPFVDVPANIVRLRLLNGATERSFNFGFSNNMVFHQIGSDGGLISAPVALTRLLLSPGERAEVLIDLNGMNGQSINLMSYASQIPAGIYGASNPQVMGSNIIPDYGSNNLNGSNFNLLQLNVIAALPAGITTIPTALANVQPIPAASAVKTRQFTFMPEVTGPTGSLIGPFLINMMPYDMMMINDTIILDDIEIWEVTNETRISHPFHVHDVQFYILDINGVAPSPGLSGRKDVVLVPPQMGTVRFIAHFKDYADSTLPYMYHCHMLTHEDGGMMGQFIVIDTTTTTGIKDFSNDEIYFTVFPNPVIQNTNAISIKYSSGSNGQVIIYDITGKELHRADVSKGLNKRHDIDVNFPDTGMYLIKLELPENSLVKKLVVYQ